MKKEKTGESDNEALIQQATNVILGRPIKFSVDGLGDFEIKKIPLGVWIMISEEAAKIQPQEGGTMLNVIGAANVNALPVARIIATCVLWNAEPLEIPAKMQNAKVLFGVKIGKDRVIEKARIISREQQITDLAEKLVNELTPEEMSDITALILNKMNPSFFLSCTSLLSGIRMMSPATPETTASGVA